MNKVKTVLEELGFIEKNGYFQLNGCQWFIEFVSPPVAVGREVIREFSNIKTSYGTIKLLRPVDSVKDRLASFYHWNDRQGLEQAVNICLEQEIDLNEVEKWSIQERQEENFHLFLERLRKAKLNK
jgi:hypothetical protein